LTPLAFIDIKRDPDFANLKDGEKKEFHFYREENGKNKLVHTHMATWLSNSILPEKDLLDAGIKYSLTNGFISGKVLIATIWRAICMNTFCEEYK